MAKILIVEDEVVAGIALMEKLRKLGYQVHENVIQYGEDVVDAVEQATPDLILMDINLKGDMKGTKAALTVQNKYDLPIVFLTAHSDEKILAEAKHSSPYAYLKKPARIDDLRVCLEITLHKARIDRENKRLIAELQAALDEVKTLRGLIPICSHCKNIRDDKGYWHTVEAYIQQHSDASFSHGICSKCIKKIYGNEDWYGSITPRS